MKRVPLIISFLMFIVVCMSLSFWGIQLFKPKARAVTVPSQAVAFEPGAGQWGNIFGASQIAQAASNYQLKGVILARRLNDSVAIVSANGKPAQAVGINQELSPGITLQEVHDQYILISENGIIKRVELPSSATIVSSPSAAINSPAIPPPNPIAFPQNNRQVFNGPNPGIGISSGVPVVNPPASAPDNQR
ncbi:type II secretion system protein N [Undibacterium sp. Xuan67W]|uniref:type II secretion system protein N n=1 Tax=Undibacterium sp. Xuan67W TaxID=3413057 RepID=UPI003BF13B3E